MKKNYLPIIIMLMLSTLVFSQKVTLTPTAVNNTNVNAGPINLASVPNSTISLNIKVEIPSNVAVNDQGTITVYYSNLNIANANVAAGGNGGNLYFGGGKTATRSMVINLYWTDFLTSGGFIFAEYKTTAGTAYRSSNLAVIKNATMTTGTTLNPPADAPNPTKINNTLCCNQTVRLGDKPQLITGSQFLNPYEKEPYGINTKWETKGNSSLNTKADFANKTLDIDYITSPENFTVTRSLGYVYRNEYPNKSNTITVTVVQSPILTNNISSTDGSVPNQEGYYELSSLKTLNINGPVSKVNLNILSDPNHTNQRGDDIKDVDSYKWEYKDIKYNSNPWITIPNANSESIDFSDPSQLSNFEDTYYTVRRIAIYKNISRVSNEFKIIVRRLRFNNTICCDQVLKINSESDFEKPSIINGTTPIIDNSGINGTNFTIKSTTFQWQVQSIDRSSSTWINIPGATSKDYLPNQVLQVINTGRQGAQYKFQNDYNYRRIVKANYEIYDKSWISGTLISYSNETNLKSISSENTIPSIVVYPNPATSIIYIENSRGDIFIKIASKSITIANTNGIIVNSNNYSIISPTKISMDISTLPPGVYFININTGDRRSTQVTFLKN